MGRVVIGLVGATGEDERVCVLLSSVTLVGIGNDHTYHC